MTIYLVTLATDYNQTGMKMWLRDMRTATENGKSIWLFISEKFKENLRGGGLLPPYTSEG